MLRAAVSVTVDSHRIDLFELLLTDLSLGRKSILGHTIFGANNHLLLVSQNGYENLFRDTPYVVRSIICFW